VVQPRNGSGTPIRWAGPAEHADPTGGRHAFDEEAALTPIFTTLRRGGWRHPRAHPPAALRPVPDPADRFRRDPQTAPIPVVPALYAVEPVAEPGHGAGEADRYGAPVSPSQVETTMWWRPESPVAAVPAPGQPFAHVRPPHVAPQPGVTPDDRDPSAPRYVPPRYEAAHHEVSRLAAPRQDEAWYDRTGYYPTAYEATGYDATGYDATGYDATGYDATGYDATGYDAVGYDVAGYDPVTDTGRHHRRLAPAGW
jgi:hypothetical protein